MKPAFALSFSENGISLHHWSDDDWYCIGTVPLDEPDFAGKMLALRDQGFALEHDLSCSLIIPADQVRVLSVETKGADPEAKEHIIRDSLANATPYAIEDLAYTTVAEEPVTQVAAVAKSTLSEAQEFARNHGFIPDRFCLCTSELDALQDPRFVLPVVTESTSEAIDLPKTAAEPHVDEQSGGATAWQFRSNVISGITLPDRKWLIAGGVAAAVLIGVAVGALSLRQSEPEHVAEPQETIEPPSIELETQPGVEVASAPTQPETPVAAPAPMAPASEVELVNQPTTPEMPQIEGSPPLSATDAAILEALQDDAILEALNVPPTPVEDITPKLDTQTAFREFTGSAPVEPSALTLPATQSLGDIYLSSIDRSDLSLDAVALPSIAILNTDEPFVYASLPPEISQSFDLDERGLVTPSAEGTLNPDGILVFLGRPSSVPPEPPVRFEADPTEPEADNALAGYRPRLRPDNLVEQFERGQLGGRSREELAVVRPKSRPDDLKVPPKIDYTPTALAVVRVPRPKPRSPNIAALVAQKPSNASAPLGSTASVATSGDESGSFQPRAVKPKIPTTASVARQATIDNAINLRKLNLIGVYGTPANRRALVRLPSGRYKKLKIGDRIDGGNVIAIGDSELRYQKGGRNVTLKMPRG